MAATKIQSPEAAETFLAKVFDILDSYDYDRFSEVLATDLQYEGGLQTASGLDNFIIDMKVAVQKMPGMKSSHTRYQNDITSDGTIYSSGHSTALFKSFPDKPITIPMIGVFRLVEEGPEAGKIKEMKVYKDRLPFLALQQQLPGMKANN
ncbi:hypothetical protein DM02DRAFT_699458 [Periconia macrospinosa]|uniref:SnoaL-like domain-containing protein n=1 Tax=Periconia macrospinosa TaxID=97972 RepID=A0A2V1D3C6_9PLEO|nr:hypothetical protein DM02DRAFT_699458 [Periconia macrospinosa]